MLKTVEESQQLTEELVRHFLKVDNPALLKTGALGTLINILNNIKYDNAMYYHKIIRELNPATLTEFNSLIFQSSVYDTTIQFSKPSLNDLNVLIPYQKINDRNIKIFNINKDTKLYSNQGLYYTLEENVKIFMTSDNIYAKSYNNGIVSVLDVDTIQDPNNTSELLNFIKIPNVQQYKRELIAQSIPSFEFGSSFSFTVPLFELKELFEIDIYIQKYKEKSTTINTSDLLKYNKSEILKFFGLEKLDIKYNKIHSNQFDNSVYLTFNETGINIEVGNGINGKKLEIGDKLFVDLKTTKGVEGNINNIDINLDNISVELKNDQDELLSFYNTNIKIISINGGSNGKDLDDIEDLKLNMIKQMNTGNSLVTLNDFENYFSINDSIPFIDSKYFNSVNNIYVYNIYKDIYNNIIYTNTFNLEKNIFKENLFFPTITYNNIDLISPFYYKEYKNFFISYMIEPKINIELYTELKETEYEEITTSIEVALLYDFDTRKSSIKLSNVQIDKTYILKTNQFNMTLNAQNGFTEIINQRHLDEYCLLEKELSEISVDIIGVDENIEKTFLCRYDYYQLKEVQKHYYYTRLQQTNTTTDIKYIIGLPYIDQNYFNNTQTQTLIKELKSFFRISESDLNIPFNVTLNKSFFNTILLEDSIKSYVVKQSSNLDLLDVKNSIIIEIILDSAQYISSEYSNISNLKFDIKNELYKIMHSSEGFVTSFYETNVENALKEKWNMIVNIDMITPKVFEINNSEDIYNAMEEDLSSGLDIFNIMDFVPPYFYFDFNNLDIDIKLT